MTSSNVLEFVAGVLCYDYFVFGLYYINICNLNHE